MWDATHLTQLHTTTSCDYDRYFKSRMCNEASYNEASYNGDPFMSNKNVICFILILPEGELTLPASDFVHVSFPPVSLV